MHELERNVSVLDLFDEFAVLIRELEARALPYALCGGMAMAVHGAPRATIDVDLLVPDARVPEVSHAAKELGYALETHLTELAGGAVKITRLTKFDPHSEDYLMLDLLHVTDTLNCFWETRQLVQSAFGQLWVVSRDGLIGLKSIRMSSQDRADIERLKEIAGER